MRSGHFAALVAMGVACCASISAQVPVTPTAPVAVAGSVDAAVADFVQAFTTLDEARFDKAWTEDATLFFPLAVPQLGGGRFTGRADVLKVFHLFFASVRKGRPGPDYLGIKPEDVHVQKHGDSAIVTFVLSGDRGVARRTLVMRRGGGGWRVAHMHASNMTMPPAAAQGPAAKPPAAQ